MIRVAHVLLSLASILSASARVFAQATPAPQPPATSSGPDDTPSIKVGMTLFSDYTYTESPEQKDTDGNTIHFSQFNISRSYINITGQVSHLVAFRVTPDIARETSSFSAIAGSLEFRIKYAYAQFNLDDWMTKGSWARFGIQQTPWVDFAEGIYRYRFQGTMFTEREQSPGGAGFLVSSDAGASFHYSFPSDLGDIHGGVYNGENYNKTETNDQKAFEVRGTLRPFPAASVLRGLRVHGFYDADRYVRDADRTRLVGSATFEHQYLTTGVEYLKAHDRTSITRPNIEGSGYSVWVIPRSTRGFELLLRYDRMTPDTSISTQTRDRTIVGGAYWFPHQGPVSAALLLDYDGQTFHNFLAPQPKQSKIAVHGLVSF